MTLKNAWKWLDTAASMLTDYEPGQIENPNQHNTVFMGTPSSGKNHTKAVIEEWGMRGDYIKTIYPHCATPGHLKEVLQYTLPNGFFEERQARREVETVRANLQAGEYDDATLAPGDLDLFAAMDDAEKHDLLTDCLDQASNDRVQQRLRRAQHAIEEKQRKGMMIKQNVADNYDVPREIRAVFDDNRGYTTNFSVQVFVPLSFGLPTGLEFPDFFTPFGIPVDDFKRYDYDKSLKIVFGESNYSSYRKLYDAVAEVGATTHADLKTIGLDDVDRSHVRQEEVAGEDLKIYVPDHNTRNVAAFKRKWSQMFDSEGVVCSSDFAYPLRSQLKEALLSDDPQCIVLYTGFLRNSGLRKFVMTYFMQTYHSILDHLSVREERNLDRKFVVSFLEAQEAILKSKQDRTLSNQDRQFNSFMHTYANQMRHQNSDFWADVKPDDCHPMLLSRTEHTVITQVNPEDWTDLFRNRKKSLKEQARNAFLNDDYRQLEGSKYGMGFILFSEGEVKEWRKSPTAATYPRMQTYGYRHLAPRQCVQRPVPFSPTDPDKRFYVDELGYGAAGRTITFDDYLAALREDWAPAEADPIAVADAQLAEEKQQAEREQKTKKELRQEMVREKLRAEVEANGIPDSWSQCLLDIKAESDNIEVGKRQLLNWTADLRAELEEQAETGGAVDVPVGEVADAMQRDPKFVIGAQSKDGKIQHAKEYITAHYECDADVAKQAAEEAVASAVNDLVYEGIIDQAHNPQVEGETREERIETFKQVMGVHDADTDAAGEDDADEAAPEPPGEPWDCPCGTHNEGDRSVCRGCGEPYDPETAEHVADTDSRESDESAANDDA